jgi:serine/threonine-protein kinase
MGPVTEIDWADVAESFADALDRPVSERPAFVRERCAGRPAVQAAVERLLAARESAGPAFLESLDAEHIEAVLAHGEVPGRIGPWRVVHEVGRGGMGQVLLAERADGQFEQRVAIKLLKRGMDSDAILTRFLRERQILAGLEHPNIARLLDGGITDDHRPYFVMEYVDGRSITEYADAHRLSIPARLDLFRTVCGAVAYAHRNLVVHRDLKPSNILVTNDGQPKLLDFGIAKLLPGIDETAAVTTLTSDGVRFMTPAYAAPEQLSGSAITTSTDVYGLGAVLYELLCGRQPFDGQSSRFHLPADAEPVTLTSALSGAGESGGNGIDMDVIAAARATDVTRLRRRLAGDLETIAGAAMRAAPERRYTSVGELEEDIRRHQEQLPVRARPDTVGYRVARFLGRHRYGVLAAASIAVLLLAFGVTASLQASALAVERDRAQSEAAAAREVSEFLVGVFEVADPMLPEHGDSVRATDLLDRGAQRIEADLAGQPDLQARMLGVIGRAFANLQRYERAEPLFERTVDLEAATAGPSSPAVVAALQQLARVRADLGDHADAESTLREAIAIQERIASESAAMWSLLVDLSYTVHGTGDYRRGNAAVADAMDLFGRIPVDDFGDSRASLGRMAELMRLGLDAETADGIFSRIVSIETAASGERSAAVAAALSSWAAARSGRGDWSGADSLIGMAVVIHEDLDPRSMGMTDVLKVRAFIAVGRQDYARAESLYRSVLDIASERLGDDDRLTAVARTDLADVLFTTGKLEESIEMHHLAIPVLRRTDEALLANSEWRLGVALQMTGRLDEAIAAFERSRIEFERRFPPDHILTANLRRDYGKALVDVGRPADAVPMLRHAIEALGARWGATDFRVDIARISLGRALIDLGRNAEAAEMLGAVHDRLLESRGPDDDLTSQARTALERVRAPTG